ANARANPARGMVCAGRMDEARGTHAAGTATNNSDPSQSIWGGRMIDITTLRAMAAAGASVDVILAAVEAELVAESARVQASKVKAAERQQRWRDKRNA